MFAPVPPAQTGQAALQQLADDSPSVGALAELQRLADAHPNPAPMQLRKYKDKDIREEIKFILGPDTTNKTAILLAVYNQMRHELDPTPGPFSSVKAATDAMVAAGKLDAGDVAAFAAEAKRLNETGGDPAAANRLRIAQEIADKRGSVEARHAHHVFNGDMNGAVPTGYHSKAGNSTTHEGYGTMTDVGNAGAYQQSVRTQDGHVRKPIQSTFFPDAATRDHVIDAITVVYELGFSTVSNVAPSVNGLKLTSRGDTVFPAGGSDRLEAE